MKLLDTVLLLASLSLVSCKDDPTRIRRDEAKAIPSPPRDRFDLKTLQGRWKSDIAKRTLNAKVEEGRLVFRVESPAEFESAYDAGETRFTLGLSTNETELLVTDHYRPGLASLTSYSPAGRTSCLFTFTAIDDKPLLARPLPDGGLSVDFAEVRVPVLPGLIGTGGTIDSCGKAEVTNRLTITLHRAK